MLKLFGGLLLVVGASGISLCICNDLKVRLSMLKEVRYMYLLIQNEVRYSALPMPLILDSVADKVKPPFRGMLKSISGKLIKNEGEILAEVWESECEKALSEISFTKGQRESVLHFPECMGMIDKEGQAKALQYKIEEAGGWINTQEQEVKEKSRVIMSLGIGAGAFAVIILL